MSGVLLLALFVLIRISRSQIDKGEQILKRFANFDLRRFEIKLSESSYSGLKQFLGPTKDAELYFTEGILIFVPSKKYYFNRLYNSLPKIIVDIEHEKLLKGKLPINRISHLTIHDKVLLTFNPNPNFTGRRIEYEFYSEKENKELTESLANFDLIKNESPT